MLKFNQNETRKIPNDWKAEIFSEAIDINPKRELKKGTETKFVSMADLNEFDKNIRGYAIRKFSGGSKFINKDTLIARITPCLENGKTVFVDILAEGEVASGSTEFIVLSAKDGKTAPHFVYYIATTPDVRKITIKSMTGTSGRQRVENDIFDKITILLPPLKEQHAIASILCSLDDKIALNRQMNSTLEAIGQALFRRWFVDFEFPDGEGKPYRSGGGEMVETELGEVPKGWRVGTVGEVLELAYGKALKDENRHKGNVPVYGSNGQIGWHDEKLVDGPGIVVGRKGNPGIVTWSQTAFFPIDTTFYVVPKSIRSMYYLVHTLRLQDLQSLGADSAVPGLNRNIVYLNKMIVPSSKILEIFDEFLRKIYNKVQDNNEQSGILAEIRDALLPKLMSGEIRIEIPLSKEKVSYDGS